MKHLIIIHGRSTKPSEKEKKRLLKESLLHGIERVSSDAAIAIQHGDIKTSYVYYGDISNKLILEENPAKKSRLTGHDTEHDHAPCEPDGFYDAGIELLFTAENQNKTDYKEFLSEYPDRRWTDEAASVISALASFSLLKEKIIAAATPDMGAYLLTRKFGSAIRERLQAPLKDALLAGDDICLVSHSLGCMVTYDVLWKFSQMSEYRDVQIKGNKVNLWLTIGNPLGESGVVDNLYDADERDGGRYPKSIIKNWVNMTAEDDFIAHDPTVKDDFEAMEESDFVENIRDETIYNFWMGSKTTNPHKIYGYLDNKNVATEIIKWIEQ